MTMATFLDDAALSERIFGHIDAGTTDLAAGMWREPTANYRDPARLADELDLLRRLPVPFCPSAALAEPGSYLARAAAGRSLVAVRDRDGQVRVFRNSCRHRGTALVDGCGRAASLSCPYHGWVYRLDGQLRHIADQHGFPGVDPAGMGLVEVPSIEVGGLVVVDQSGTADLAAWPLPDTMIAADAVVHEVTDREVPANWKVFMEGFLEGYHIKATHRTTFFPLGFDNLNVVEHDGPHSRVTFPFRRIERLRSQAPGERRLAGSVTRVVQLFPNVVIAELSHHTSVVVLEPLTPTTTRSVTYQLVRRADVAEATSADRAGAQLSAAAARDRDFVTQGAKEDQDMIRAVQRGLDSEANDEFVLGLFEGALSHFHRNLHAHLNGTATPVRLRQPAPAPVGA
jgi:phenylpropionate dioxygenase-like ring-hydroxylating dioxygenase large terminal subunit